MSVCKDCIHFEACVEFLYSDYDCCDNIETSKQKHANDDTCVHFKATADVVETVRCKDCKWFEGIGHINACKNDRNTLVTQNNPKRVHVLCVSEDHYCSYGERSNE